MDIPPEAYTAWHGLDTISNQDVFGPVQAAIDAAAPLIVAAELARIAPNLPGKWMSHDPGYQRGRFDALRFLQNRADELRGEA